MSAGRLAYFLFPPRCIFCRDFLPYGSEIYVCRSCAAQYAQFAPRFISLPDGASGCYALPYDKNVRRAILAFKFYHRIQYAKPLSSYLSPLIALYSDVDFITWVPSNPFRVWLRGYNQSQRLAEYACRPLGLTPVPLLRRVRLRPSQTKVRDRFKNTAGTVRALKRYPLEGRSVLVIDDIVTSGATLCECGRALRAEGAAKIYYAALAHHE